MSKLAPGVAASLMVELRITDETIKLYGFSSPDEREWFRLLQTVQNVGARVALNVLSALSPRELDVVKAVGAGQSNAEIAAALLMSVPTVKAHVTHILTKAGLANRTQIALLAHDAGLA